MGRVVFYARVSTRDQKLDLQLDAARKLGVRTADLFVEKASGIRHDRPALAKALAVLKPGDTLACYKLDRIGRSLGSFVQQNFLAPDLLAHRVRDARVAQRAGAWLAEPPNAHRAGGTWKMLPVRVEARELVRGDDHGVVGPAVAGCFIRMPMERPAGTYLAPHAAEFWRWADTELGLDIGPLGVAEPRCP